jgi:hypothetical protein
VKRAELVEMINEARTEYFNAGAYDMARLMSTLKYAVQILED